MPTKKIGTVVNPEFATVNKKTATLQPNKKIQKPSDETSPDGHDPTAVSRALKDPNLSDKDLMEIFSQDTPLGADDNRDPPTAAEKTATISQPNAKIRKLHNDAPPAVQPTNAVSPSPRNPNLTDEYHTETSAPPQKTIADDNPELLFAAERRPSSSQTKNPKASH